MATDVWGELAKAQDDPQTVNEAIIEAIDNHNADAASHLDFGQSLENHRTVFPIDHPDSSAPETLLDLSDNTNRDATESVHGFMPKLDKIKLDGIEDGATNGGAHPPQAHHVSHENGGTDEISVAGLSGLLGDGQTPLAHHTSHENGGGDEISVAGLSGLLGDAQTPTAHHTSHENGGTDEITVEGLSGALADPQTPTSHHTSHESGGGDAIKLDDLSAPDDNTDLNASSAKHGLLIKSPADATKFLNGASPNAFAAVKDSDLATTDVTDNNFGTSKHGFVPKGSSDTTKFLRADGSFQIPGGSFVAMTVKVSGTTFTTNARTTILIVRMVGAGAGGAGVATAGLGQLALGGGGGGGGYCIKVYDVAGATGYTYAIGAKGTGGANTGANGNDGGDTTFTDGSTLITAKGGKGGIYLGPANTLGVVLGGDGGAISTNGDLNGAGENGGYGTRLSGAVGAAGMGGHSRWGRGGNSRITNGAGNDAIGNGAGGGSAVSISGAVTGAKGGDGVDGAIEFWEFA